MHARTELEFPTPGMGEDLICRCCATGSPASSQTTATRGKHERLLKKNRSPRRQYAREQSNPLTEDSVGLPVHCIQRGHRCSQRLSAVARAIHGSSGALRSRAAIQRSVRSGHCKQGQSKQSALSIIANSQPVTAQQEIPEHNLSLLRTADTANVSRCTRVGAWGLITTIEGTLTPEVLPTT